ncbi:MAG: sensor histidine kinase [Candidatus Aminicenantes bacterium]|nr:sensor histidine kinase [Candidatus Aminicenantes bacterium]
MKKTLADIRQMHRDVSKITREKERKCYEYLDDFVGAISLLIEKFEIFSDHIAWECIYDKVPGNLQVEEKYILRDAAKKERRNAPIKSSETFNYPKDRYFLPPLNKKDFGEKFSNYFSSGTLSEVFEIPLKPGFSCFNLPVFSEKESLPQWILTLVHKEEESDFITGQDFFEILEHVSYEIGLAWNRFREYAADRLLEIIDYRLAGGKKTRSDSTLDQLRIITRTLSAEIQAEWCAFFLVDEQEKILRLETGNVEPENPIIYCLADKSDIMVNSFTGNEVISFSGRKSLEDTIGSEKMRPLERAIRQVKKLRKVKQRKGHFTPYVLFEHTLFFPIAVGAKRIGFMTLFRAKKTHKPEPEDRFEYVTRPFSEFETDLLEKVQRRVFDIIISQDAAQKRMRDVISQVISPIHALISTTGNPVKGDKSVGNLSKKLDEANALSRIAEQYVMNFETLLDIDTRKLKLRKERIPDLRKYLINIAMLYTPLIRPKCISINVTGETRSDISIEIDKDLFGMVISNIVDNAVKYSFDPEDRIPLGLQAKPESTKDKENVLITAEAEKNFITITVSNYGINIPEGEKRRIFDREFRGVHAPDRAKGTGIGLFVPNEIIKKHGGSIELVPDTPEYNTVFEITLPAKGAEKSNKPRNNHGDREE